MRNSKLEKFKNYVFQELDSYIGIYPIKTKSFILKDLLGKNSYKEYTPVCKTGDGSLFVEKEIIDKSDKSKISVFIFIGSEGQKETVALNEDEFIAILLYDVGLFFDIILDINLFKTDSENYSNPIEFYNSEYLESILDENKEEYEKYSELLEWADSILNIKPSENPALVILNASKKYPFTLNIDKSV